MVYRPDGSGRDMYVLGPRNTNGPRIIDVCARMDALANRGKLNASLHRSDNKIPHRMPEYELKAMVTKRIEDRSANTAEQNSLSPARLILNAAVLNNSNADNFHLSASAPVTSRTMVEGMDLTGTMCASRYNSGVSAGGNSPSSAAQLKNISGDANGYFTTTRRSPSAYVSPKTPSSPSNITGRLGGTAYRQALLGASTVAAILGTDSPLNSTTNSKNNTLQTNAAAKLNLDSTLSDSIATASSSSSLRRRAPSAGFSYNRHIYESTAERSRRTGLTFQPYEAPATRTHLPEVRARYSNI